MDGQSLAALTDARVVEEEDPCLFVPFGFFLNIHFERSRPFGPC